MYCGSCLHDNALAKSLIQLGHDAMLVPTYTPILTDEGDISEGELFYGGLNVYLQQASSLFRWLPRWADSFLSTPKLVGWIASRAMGTTANNLGAMTVSMLKGTDGRQKKEVLRLCDWLKEQQPDVVLFSNLLIAGCIPELQRQLGCKTVVTLQGDDIFYDSLEAPYQEQAIAELRRLAQMADRFIVHSEDYGRRMQERLQFSEDKLAINPLSLDVKDYASLPRETASEPTIGYLARLAPEKGLHLLADAFIKLRADIPNARLAIAGWLGKQHEPYWAEVRKRLDSAGLTDAYTYHGAVDRQDKLKFLQSIHVLSVPTPYLEPKGLFVLESIAAGVPYAQPAHGAFPELHERFGGGHLYEAGNGDAHAELLAQMLRSEEESSELGRQGQQRLFSEGTTAHEAQRLLEILEQI